MSQLLEVTVRRDGDIGIVETEGHITDSEAEKVADAGSALIEAGVKHLVLNLEKSAIANCLGIPALIHGVAESGGTTRDGGGRSGRTAGIIKKNR